MREWVWIGALGWTLVCMAVNAYTWRVAYPLWRFVGDRTFAAVHREYMRRLDPVITVPHMLMFFCSGGQLFVRPEWYPAVMAGWVFGLETMVILVSAFVAGPVHSRFTRNGVVDETGMVRLVRVSALRSGLMMVAGGLMLWALRRRV